jgi:hypothetical protein
MLTEDGVSVKPGTACDVTSAFAPHKWLRMTFSPHLRKIMPQRGINPERFVFMGGLSYG